MPWYLDVKFADTPAPGPSTAQGDRRSDDSPNHADNPPNHADDPPSDPHDPSPDTGHPSDDTGHPSSDTGHPSDDTGHPSDDTGHPSDDTNNAANDAEGHRGADASASPDDEAPDLLPSRRVDHFDVTTGPYPRHSSPHRSSHLANSNSTCAVNNHRAHGPPCH